MEYTDAPSTQTADTMLCPNCGQRLPAGSESCDQCDWKREERAEGTASDASLLDAIEYAAKLSQG